MNQQAYKTENKPIKQLIHVLSIGDISMVLLLGGMGLILWALFGLFAYRADLAAYAGMFPFGTPLFWFANYLFCGIAMWVIVALQYPALLSLLVGSWCVVAWSWSALARMTAVATLQTGNATSVIYIIIGILIIHRSSRYHGKE